MKQVYHYPNLCKKKKRGLFFFGIPKKKLFHIFKKKKMEISPPELTKDQLIEECIKAGTHSSRDALIRLKRKDLLKILEKLTSPILENIPTQPPVFNEDKKHPEILPPPPPSSPTPTLPDITFYKADNPEQQKYNRFEELKDFRRELITAINKNTEVLKQYEQKLDVDTLRELQKEIKTSQDQLQLVVAEICQISQWFNEEEAQKIHFYKQLEQESVDISGNLKHHFQQKINNIKLYLSNLQNLQ